MTELLKLKWAGQGEAVAASYTGFLCNLVSANTRFTRPAVRFIIENFKGCDKEADSEVRRTEAERRINELCEDQAKRRRQS